MSEFLNKSHFNRDAADLLITSHYYAPSVKCSYYRCILIMLHILHYKEGYTKTTFDAGRNGQGTHSYATKLIENCLAIKVGIHNDDYKYFQKIYDLKKLRVKADYEDRVISQEDSVTARNYSSAISTLLIKNL